jgi:glucosamine--fructose-6-phosphate aminotransferase (isomerizing)
MHYDQEGLDLISSDIERQAATLGGGSRALRDAVSEVAAAVPWPPSRVYLIGCGDSLDGGMAARYVWEGLVGLPVEAVPAMTFAASVLDLAPPDALVVALSQSGKVSRVIEAIRRSRSRGLSTVTITADADSALANEPSDASWVIGFDKVGAVPGTTSHLLGTVALYELGCALAPEGDGTDRVRSDLDDLADLVQRAISVSAPLADRHADAMGRDLPVLALGYGPSLSSARYTIRKLLELTQLVALWQETEEYAHDEYSLMDSRFRVMQFAPPGPGAVRSGEVARYLHRLGVHLSVVTGVEDADRYADVADVTYPIATSPPSLVPLVYSVPGQLLSLAVARTLGGSLYGMAEQVHREDGDPQIYESEIAL